MSLCLHLAEKPQIKKQSLKQNHEYLIHTLSYKAFKGTVVNRTLVIFEWRVTRINVRFTTVPLKALYDDKK